MARLYVRRPVIERILAKITIDPETGCWLWPGHFTPAGYGGIIVGSRGEGTLRNGLVHREVYVHYHGPIPKGLHTDHLCRVRHCCNPDHLEIVTPRENTLRGLTPAAANAAKTHCPAGHPYEGDNLRVADGRRHCRACARHKMWMRNYRRRGEPRQPKPCGTFAASQRHLLRGEAMCEPCRVARSEHRRAADKRRKEARANIDEEQG